MNIAIRKDLFRYEGARANNILIQIRYILFTPGFQYIYLFRHVQLACCGLTRVMWRSLLKWCEYKWAIQIPAGTQIGEGFRIAHYGNIVVNPATKIGRNFNIAEGALIGNAQGKHAGIPVIGDNVCMNANSMVIGGVHIGNNVLIAPGAFVNFDVPDNSIVIGNPGKIIPRDSSPTKKYIVYSVDDFNKR